MKNKKKRNNLIDLPSLYGEEWTLRSNKIRQTSEFTKHHNPKKINKDVKSVTNHDLQQIRSIAFSDKYFLNDQSGKIYIKYFRTFS